MLVQQYSIESIALCNILQQLLNLMLVQQYSIASATLELNACAAILDCKYSIALTSLELNACAAILDCIGNT